MDAGGLGYGGERVIDVEDVFFRVMVHVADGSEVEEGFGDSHFFRGEDCGGFGAGPGEVVAVVFEGVVGVLGCVEAAALAVAHPVVDPDYGLAGYPGALGLGEGLEGVDVIFQQFGVVVGHLLEVRDDPALIDGVAVETAGKVIVDAAFGHFFKRDHGGEAGGGGLRTDTGGGVDEQIESAGLGELGLRAEATEASVELLEGGGDNFFNEFCARACGAAVEGFVVLDGGHDAAG